jgi:hypothetical protein
VEASRALAHETVQCAVMPLYFSKGELFPTVVIVNICFPIDRRELFSIVSVAVWICALNISLWSVGKGMFTTTTIGKSSFFNFMAQCVTHTTTLYKSAAWMGLLWVLWPNDEHIKKSQGSLTSGAPNPKTQKCISC